MKKWEDREQIYSMRKHEKEKTVISRKDGGKQTNRSLFHKETSFAFSNTPSVLIQMESGENSWDCDFSSSLNQGRDTVFSGCQNDCNLLSYYFRSLLLYLPTKHVFENFKEGNRPVAHPLIAGLVRTLSKSLL